MATHKLLLLPGDGIGPEVMAEVKRLIDWLNAQGIAHFETEQDLVGGSAYDASKQSITDATMAKADAADAVIFGAVGGPKCCFACARNSACSRTCAPRCAIPRLRMPRA
jgi:3-isopropylmalate dehydrogenase